MLDPDTRLKGLETLPSVVQDHRILVHPQEAKAWEAPEQEI